MPHTAGAQQKPVPPGKHFMGPVAHAQIPPLQFWVQQSALLSQLEPMSWQQDPATQLFPQQSEFFQHGLDPLGRQAHFPLVQPPPQQSLFSVHAVPAVTQQWFEKHSPQQLLGTRMHAVPGAAHAPLSPAGSSFGELLVALVASESAAASRPFTRGPYTGERANAR